MFDCLCLVGAADCGAWVQVVEPDVELLAPLEIVLKGSLCLLAFGRIGVPEIDEVRAVRKNVGPAVEVVVATSGFEVFNVGWLVWV